MKPTVPMLSALIRAALREDLGTGDITTMATVPPQARVRARVLAKAPGVVAGADVARQVFAAVDRRIRCTIVRRDGRCVRSRQAILHLEGPARSLLIAERTALNFLGHLSGIATLTQAFVKRVRPYRTKLLDTRKTLPGLRWLEKYAVKVGGGTNHRFGLDDAVLIKTNHLRALRRSEEWGVESGELIEDAVAQTKRKHPGRFIEVEVTTLAEFHAALKARPHAILLDNWRLPAIRKAVALKKHSSLITHHSSLLEVSGGVTLANVRAIAKTGVDRISIGRLTHSAPALDVSLRVDQ